MFRVHRVFWWVVGLVAMIAFSANTLEVLFPDAHDGDAQSTVTLGLGHATNQAPTVPDAPTGPHHAQHVDHCSHGHVATVSTGVAIDEQPPCPEERPSSISTALISVASTPSSRPPIL
jgi:hypothetical protein